MIKIKEIHSLFGQISSLFVINTAQIISQETLLNSVSNDLFSFMMEQSHDKNKKNPFIVWAIFSLFVINTVRKSRRKHF
jgi:hypothetical protein